MAPSNALSGRRQPLRRPKVCKSAPNPGRCHPPPPPPPQCDCYFDPFPIEGEPDEEIPFNIHACKLYLTAHVVSVALSAEYGDLVEQTTTTNCITGGDLTYQSDTAGTFWIKAVITFEDASTCEVGGSVTINEPE